MAMIRNWLVVLIAIGSAGLTALAVPTPSQWDKPASTLAEQIAEILGPSQVQLTIRNLSTISSLEVPSIRRLLEQDLKARGVVVSGAESANAIRITLSESSRDRVWVAEIVEGNETRMAMVQVALEPARVSAVEQRIILRKEKYIGTAEPVLAALETATALVLLEPEQIVFYGHSAEGWKELHRASVGTAGTLARDPRGALLGSSNGSSIEAWLPGVQCSGSTSPAPPSSEWKVQCRLGDDAWAITQPFLQLTNSSDPATNANVSAMPVRAFYNASRNYFTGVLTSGPGPDLPPFYSLAIVPRAAGGAALLIGGIDGKVQLVDNGALKAVTGTRDWGSDFAVLGSGCGTGAQVIASASGEAASESLRAYELVAQEAVPVSIPVAMQGVVTALWTAPDTKSVLAVVRNAANEYEVDRVTALCN
jgi:hypothetical protein